MKFINQFCLFLASTGLASAVPVSQLPSDLDHGAHELVGYGSNEVELRSLNTANPLEARIDCRKYGNTIVRIGTSSAV